MRTCSNDFRDKQGVLKLMVGGRGTLCTIYQITSYLQLLACFVDINIQPEYELPSSTHFGQI